MYFHAVSKSSSGIGTLWTSASSAGEIAIAIPPEFSGPGGGFSPEDLYAMALVNCFIATFKVIAEKSKLLFENIEVKAKLCVDRGDGGKPWMASIHFDIFLSGANDKDRAQKLLEKTSEQCMILNSTKTQKTFQFHFA